MKTDEELARSNAEGGTLRVVRRVRGYETVHAIWDRLEGSTETQLDEAGPRASGVRWEVRLADLNRDDVPDVIVDRGDRGGPPSSRFAVYLSEGDRIHGTPDDMVWRTLDGITNIDAAVGALSRNQPIDSSIPEICGMLDRAPRGGVEAWHWVDDDKGWARAKKKRSLGWSCGQLDKDGAGYWMPELACSPIVPACKAQLFSGGHGGTERPDRRYLFFRRLNGRLELEAVAHGDN